MPSPPPPGVYVPAVLFFDEHEEFDFLSIRAHILRLAQGGVTGILVQGSNGEAQHLSHDERKAAIRFTRETLDRNGFNNVLILAGTGAQSTRETKKLCIDAKEAGASYALVLTPSTWVPQMTRDNIIRFHEEVAGASPIPVLIYNFPVVTAGQDLDSDIITELAQHPNIVGIKLSDGNIGKLQRLTTLFPSSEFAVYAGRADFFLHGLLSGSAGTIAALANIIPKVHGRLYQLWKEGKMEEAFKLQGQLGHADWAIGKIGGISGVKAIVVNNFEYGVPHVRGPLKAVAVENLKGVYYEKLKGLIALEKEL